MKKILALAAAALLTIALNAATPTGVTIMSYNIRVGSANDGTNSWEYRYPASAMMISDQKPDVVGLQEALSYQVRYLSDFIDGYKAIGTGKDKGDVKCHHMTMFYNSKTTSVVKWGSFWLSETPDKASRGWDAAQERSATWAIFKDKRSGKKYMVVNTHLDREGAQARSEGLALILDRIAGLNGSGLPVVLIGDFNMKGSDSAFAPMKGVMQNARSVAAKSDDTPSYNGWGKASETIDHIWFSGFSSCTEFQTVTKPYQDRKFISDHYPVKATLFF